MTLTNSNPVTTHQRRAVGVFPNHRATEIALAELRDSGFPMDRVSVITQDANHPGAIAGADVRDSTRSERASDRVGNKADEGATVGAISGGALGGLTGLLVGLGTLAIPGVGPIMLAGATATALATTLAGGAIGAATGGIWGALVGLGIPEERARVYRDRIAKGEYLVIVDGTETEIARAAAILHRRGIEEYGVYSAPVATATSAATTTTTGTAVATPAPIATEPVGIDMSRPYRAVGYFSRLEDAEHAVVDLRSIGFPLAQVALVANQTPQSQYLGGVDLRDRFEAMRLGIPVERARMYNDQMTQGNYLVIVTGNQDELDRAAAILRRRGIQDWNIYDASAVNPSKHPDFQTDRVAPDLDIQSNDTVPPIATDAEPNVVIIDRRTEGHR